MKKCFICQGIAPLHRRSEFPGYVLCDHCTKAGYKLQLGAELEYYVLIPSAEGHPPWLSLCRWVRQLLAGPVLPNFLGPRARLNPTPPKPRKERKNAPEMPTVSHHK